MNFNTRTCERIFKQLKDQCATGPDQLFVKILKFIAPFISIPFSRLVSKMVEEAHWPDAWRVHRLIPLYKKNAYFDIDDSKLICVMVRVLCYQQLMQR